MATSGKRKRNDLTLADKYEVVKLLDQKLSQAAIAKKLDCSQSQVSRISLKREDIRTQFEANSNPHRKRQRTGKDSDVETALSTWFTDARARDIPITGPILEGKAKDLASHMKKEDFTPTSGWLSRWKQRNGITYKRICGEKRDADITAADNWITTVLPELLSKYEPRDIYNADETGIYYRALPDGTLASKAETVSGSKKAKDRITAMICCNMDGTDKRPLLVLGKSKNPRCFRGQSSLPVIYDANQNAWMTAVIFTDWLKKFDREMRLKKRNILLLVDNCAAHPQTATTAVKNISLVFLPPNTTSVIQPCDQGIIKNLKTHYRRHIINDIITQIDNDATLMANALAKKLTLLTAVHLLNRSWRDVTATTIINCYRKAGFEHQREDTPTDDTPTTDPTESTTPDADFEEYVNIDADLECHGTLSDESICASILKEETEEPEEPDNSDDEEEIIVPTPASEIRDFLRTKVQKFLGEKGCKDFEPFYAFQRFIDEHSTREQTKITEFIDVKW
ncbi:tigger transposable element-derived protein 4-like [Pecten maximus]|uniref:tigger transposable element-derived protein 4-like n=1 Tax=Pecten maximus TaxID=6579 RepID=UPI00145849FE|nr:tigger transposable element-derived protein 4-like [Pecten maximus]